MANMICIILLIDEAGRKRLVSISSIEKEKKERSMSVSSNKDLKRMTSVGSKAAEVRSFFFLLPLNDQE